MIKLYNPYTPSRRATSVEDFSWLTKKKPEKSLLAPLRKKAGRNNTGEIMVRHQGGGHKKMLRLVDFKREKHGIPAKVVAFEYDPNRSARLALLHYADGEKRYILHADGMAVGDVLVSGPEAEIKVGNALPLSHLPEGTVVHAIELVPGTGAKLVRSAGASAQIMAKEGPYAQVRMPSGEIRLIPIQSLATIGQVGNAEHETISYGNAGRRRRMGIRPTVRGTAMNAVDHPHGGGRGKSKGANHPSSPWNQPAKGFKTRPKKQTDWMIIKRRTKTTGTSEA